MTKVGWHSAVCRDKTPFSHLSSLSRGRNTEDQRSGIKGEEEREKNTQWGRDGGRNVKVGG